MITVHLNVDEDYPVYTHDFSYGTRGSAEVTKEQAAKLDALRNKRHKAKLAYDAALAEVFPKVVK